MKWAPPWCPTAEGDFEVGEAPIHIDLSCSICGDKSHTVCMQGMPRSQIARYALLHMHGEDKARWDGKKQA